VKVNNSDFASMNAKRSSVHLAEPV